MEEPRSKPKRRPRKQLFVDQIDQLLKLTEAQLKIWLYHYRREGGGDGRKSFALQTTVREATELSRSAISHARTWLVRNGWLRVVGRFNEDYGNASLREYRCAFPKAPESTSVGTGKPKRRHPEAYGVGTGKPKGQAPESLEEVEPPIEVTAQAPIPREVILTTNSFGEGKKEEVKEAAESTTSKTLQDFLLHTLTPQESQVWDLMRMVHSYWSEEEWAKEYPLAADIYLHAQEEGYNPFVMLLMNYA